VHCRIKSRPRKKPARKTYTPTPAGLSPSKAEVLGVGFAEEPPTSNLHRRWHLHGIKMNREINACCAVADRAGGGKCLVNARWEMLLRLGDPLPGQVEVLPRPGALFGSN
jgi:hypothetical protein